MQFIQSTHSTTQPLHHASVHFSSTFVTTNSTFITGLADSILTMPPGICGLRHALALPSPVPLWPGNSVTVHAFHTFPDHCAIVKTQSLLEWS